MGKFGMGLKRYQQVRVHDFKPDLNDFRSEVLSGLQKPQKELPCKYLYDEHGSYLYECICALDEYYIPRTERAIMETHIDEMVELIGPNALLIEYGSGSSVKTRILLDHLPDLAGYVPIDICPEQLLSATRELTSFYPELEVLPVCADYTSRFELPVPRQPSRRNIVYFPGSTIGNFELIQARNFLKHIAWVCGPGGGLIIGVDLKKDPYTLHCAYNDRNGVTAAFNLNLLERINRELNSDFQLEWFKHYAFYNPDEGRVEMHIVSLREQTVRIDNMTIPFTEGETIWTESSYKFNLNQFEQMANASGFKVERVWTDEKQWFSVQYLVKSADYI